MKVVLFCGGYGMRMRDGMSDLPKPMHPVGPRPLIWHVGRLLAHRHRGFWQPADTVKERHALEAAYRAGNRPWMLWEPELGTAEGAHRLSIPRGCSPIMPARQDVAR